MSRTMSRDEEIIELGDWCQDNDVPHRFDRYGPTGMNWLWLVTDGLRVSVTIQPSGLTDITVNDSAFPGSKVVMSSSPLPLRELVTSGIRMSMVRRRVLMPIVSDYVLFSTDEIITDLEYRITVSPLSARSGEPIMFAVTHPRDGSVHMMIFAEDHADEGIRRLLDENGVAKRSKGLYISQ